MSSQTRNRIAQSILLTAWIIIVVLNYPPFVSSQIDTCEHPKYAHQPIHISSWFPGTQVTVKIDSWFPDDQRKGLQRGNNLWNHETLGCSGVKFLNYGSIDFWDYTETPPAGFLWWQRDDPGTGFNGGVFAEISVDGFVESARIKITPSVPNVAQGTYFDYLGTHEVGHTFNLNDCISTTGCKGTEDTIMRGHSDGITSSNTFNTTGPKKCDLMKVRSIYCTAASPTPTPTPSPPPNPVGCSVTPNFLGNCPSGYSNNGCGGCCSDAERDACINSGYMWNEAGGGYCRDPNSVCWEQQYECMIWDQYWDMFACACVSMCAPTSPILVDVSGDGFNLTDNAGGVFFDLNGDGIRERLSWTTSGDDDAWLVFDRDGDGVIGKGAELFGNFTYQPETRAWERHGFLALSEFDKQASSDNGGYGGNGDGLINKDDLVFAELRLWQDTNHNGVSEPTELHPLTELGLHSISLAYTELRRRDRYGNSFRYRAKVTDERGAQFGRWAWDVFLLRAQ